MIDQGMLETRFNCRVTKFIKKESLIDAIETTTGIVKADAYVLATGSESLNLVEAVGLKLPIYPIKGYSITVPATDKTPDICITDMAHKIVFARIGDHLRVAGLADIGYGNNVDESRINYLINVAKKVLPQVGNYDEVLHKWTGSRPATPSSVPIIGRAGTDNLYLNVVGHGMFGWTLAMGSSALLKSIINQEDSPIDMAGMRPSDHGVI